MPENKHARLLVRLLYTALALLGLWLFLTVLLPWLLPFLLALLLAWALERPVAFLTQRLSLPRWAAAAICTVVLSLLLCGALGLVLWRLGYEASLLLGRLPTLLSALPSLGAALEDWAPRWAFRNSSATPWTAWSPGASPSRTSSTTRWPAWSAACSPPCPT